MPPTQISPHFPAEQTSFFAQTRRCGTSTGRTWRALAEMLGDERAFGQAYNLAQDETPTLRELVERLAWAVGAPAKLVSVPVADIEAAGLSVRQVSPLSPRWMSDIDPRRAKAKLGFVHTPLWEYVGRVVASFLAHPPVDRPPGYAGRAREVELARVVR